MKTYKFKAEIKEARRGGSVVEFPYDVRKEFRTGGQVKITATFDGVEYRGSLAPMGGGTHFVGMTKAIRAKIGKDVGDTIDVVIQQDQAPREVMVPEVLQTALDADPAAAERFTSLSYTRRKEMARDIESAVKEETKRRRLLKILDELRSGR